MLNGFGPVFCIVQRNQWELQLRRYRCQKLQCGGFCVSIWCLNHTAPKWYNNCQMKITGTGLIFVYSYKTYWVPIISSWKKCSSVMKWHSTDHCSSEEYWCTHVDVCVARTLISYRCVPCHPWCIRCTSLVVKKTFSVFLWLWTIPLR